MLALIALRGYTLQNATIEAKAYNATTNLMSLFVFLAGGPGDLAGRSDDGGWAVAWGASCGRVDYQ